MRGLRAGIAALCVTVACSVPVTAFADIVVGLDDGHEAVCTGFTVSEGTGPNAELAFAATGCGPIDVEDTCINGQQDPGEQCDRLGPTYFDGPASCSARGLVGTIGCSTACQTIGCTAAPTPGPTPGPTPEPSGNCANVGPRLDDLQGNNIWGLEDDAYIPPGEHRDFCIEVNDEFVPNNATINTIWASFDNSPDSVCSRVTITLQQMFGQGHSDSASGNSGSAQLLRKKGGGGFGNRNTCDTCVSRGVYRLRVQNTFASNPSVFCSEYVLRWGWG